MVSLGSAMFYALKYRLENGWKCDSSLVREEITEVESRKAEFFHRIVFLYSRYERSPVDGFEPGCKVVWGFHPDTLLYDDVEVFTPHRRTYLHAYGGH
jgi:hypothetical protein